MLADLRRIVCVFLKLYDEAFLKAKIIKWERDFSLGITSALLSGFKAKHLCWE